MRCVGVTRWVGVGVPSPTVHQECKRCQGRTIWSAPRDHERGKEEKGSVARDIGVHERMEDRSLERAVCWPRDHPAELVSCQALRAESQPQMVFERNSLSVLTDESNKKGRGSRHVMGYCVCSETG